MNYQFNNKNNERFWGPILAGAAIISAPFWFGLSKNNNNNNCCYPQPYYQPYYPPYPQPIYPNYPNYVANNNYYI